jgi:RecB family exonuclease
LRQADAFYSASLETDPVGTARVLLQWRDELSLQGWNGEVKKGRLADLAAVNHLVTDGLGDRLRSIRNRLATMPPRIDSLELSEVEADLPLEWLKTIAALREGGTEVRELAFESPPRSAEFQLFRPQGPRSAADQVAAWLASARPDPSTVIIAGDASLDLALRRHGLPTTGAAEAAPGLGFQMLALCMGIAFWPPDPKRVQEFLSLRPNPLPESLCRRLLLVLAEHPGVGNRAWNGALEKGMLEVEESARQGIMRSVQGLLSAPEASAEPVTEIEAADFIARLDLIDEWIRSNSELELEEHARVSAELRAVFSHNADRPWDMLRLSRWLAEIASSCRRPALFPAETGLARVDTPAALLGPANRVIWWSFVRGPDDRDGGVPWTDAERRALRAAGIPWPSAAERAQRRAAHWQRPVMHAAQLLLVAPQYGEDGEECHPHPLYDELIGKKEKGKSPESKYLRYQTRTPALLPLPLASDRFQLQKGSLTARESESANSLETLISCPYAYALKYQERLRPGVLRALATGNRLIGSFAHALFAELLDPERAEDTQVGSARGKKLSTELSRRFHRLAPFLLAELYQAGGGLELRRQEQILVRAYEQLRPLLARSGLKVVACEREYSSEDGRVPCGKLAGRLDLVLGPELAVLDLKSGKSRYLSDALEEGRSVQLAVYSRLLMSNAEAGDVTKPWPKAGYYLLAESRSLSTEPFLSDTAIRGADPRHTFFAACKTARRTWRSMSEGSVATATGIDGDGRAIDFSKFKKSDGLSQGITEEEALHLHPSCDFCDYSGLCGHSLEAAQP